MSNTRAVERTELAAGPPPARDAAPAESGAASALALQLAQRTQRELAAAGRSELTANEEAFCRAFVARRNATLAYIDTHDTEGVPRAQIRQLAFRLINRSWILARVAEYESAAAAACIIDVQALIEHDKRIVAGFEHADQISANLWQACRYCHGAGHKYQWVDFNEYIAAVQTVNEENEERAERKQRALPLPSDDGGYGYKRDAEPVVTCPQCEGRGLQVTVIADTTQLEGPARAIVKGVKVTQAGIEVLLHDVDKAKERLYKAAGAFGDEGSNVERAARGAAAGGAAGAAAASALAKRVHDMTPDEARKAYLSLVNV